MCMCVVITPRDVTLNESESQAVAAVQPLHVTSAQSIVLSDSDDDADDTNVSSLIASSPSVDA